MRPVLSSPAALLRATGVCASKKASTGRTPSGTRPLRTSDRLPRHAPTGPNQRHSRCPRVLDLGARTQTGRNGRPWTSTARAPSPSGSPERSGRGGTPGAGMWTPSRSRAPRRPGVGDRHLRPRARRHARVRWAPRRGRAGLFAIDYGLCLRRDAEAACRGRRLLPAEELLRRKLT